MPSKYICLYVRYWFVKQSQSSYLCFKFKTLLKFNHFVLISLVVFLGFKYKRYILIKLILY